MTSRDTVVGVWEFVRSIDRAVMVQIALGRLRDPDLRAQVISSTGDTITVQVVDGTVPLDPEAVLYVERRGAYEVRRRETWPSGRVLLHLEAWPQRRHNVTSLS